MSESVPVSLLFVVCVLSRAVSPQPTIDTADCAAEADRQPTTNDVGRTEQQQLIAMAIAELRAELQSAVSRLEEQNQQLHTKTRELSESARQVEKLQNVSRAQETTIVSLGQALQSAVSRLEEQTQQLNQAVRQVEQLQIDSRAQNQQLQTQSQKHRQIVVQLEHLSNATRAQQETTTCQIDAVEKAFTTRSCEYPCPEFTISRTL